MQPKPIPAEGPLDAKILILGDHPTKDESLNLRPFSSGTARILREKLRAEGIAEQDCRFEYLMPVFPPTGKFSFFKDNEKEYEELLIRVTQLKKQIKEMSPNVVVLIGADCLYYFTGKSPIGDWRGHIIWQEDINCKCIAIYDLLTTLRQRFVDSKNFPGQYEALLSIDLQRIKAESVRKETSFPDYKLIVQPSFQQALEELERLYEEAKILSFDIETIGKDTPIMSCISFAATTERAISVPLYYAAGEEQKLYYSETETCAILQRIIRLLESNIPKVAQNAQFDCVILEHIYGIRVRNLMHDTLCGAHNLYCELPKDLGSLISQYSSFAYHKHMGSSSSNLEFWQYNALDSLVTLAIMQGQVKDMQDRGILQHFRTVTMPLLRPLMDMQLQGVKVDIPLKNKALAGEQNTIDTIDWIAEQLFCKGANISATQQTAKIFYDGFGCKKVYSDGSVTTGEDAMLKLQDDKRKLVRDLASLVLRKRGAIQMRGRLQPEFPDGRIRCKYSAAGTVTGRLSSKEPDIGEGTNLQNLQKGIQREMLVVG